MAIYSHNIQAYLVLSRYHVNISARKLDLINDYQSRFRALTNIKMEQNSWRRDFYWTHCSSISCEAHCSLLDLFAFHFILIIFRRSWKLILIHWNRKTVKYFSGSNSKRNSPSSQWFFHRFWFLSNKYRHSHIHCAHEALEVYSWEVRSPKQEYSATHMREDTKSLSQISQLTFF